VTRPLLLDLCCGEGLAARGYHAAGWDVVGVDLKDTSKRYPYPFMKGDALKVLRTLLAGRSVPFRVPGTHSQRWLMLDRFTAAHMSAPCQRWAANGNRDNWPDLITPGRELLNETGLPWVMENVPRAPLRDPVQLCGTMFNLTAVDEDDTKLYLQRHRNFETNWDLLQPPHHDPAGVQWAGAYGGARSNKDDARNVRHGGYVPKWKTGLQQKLMLGDIPCWTTQKGLQEGIPPVYAEYVGTHMLGVLP